MNDSKNGAGSPPASKAAASPSGASSPAMAGGAAANLFEGRPMNWRRGWQAKAYGVRRDRPPEYLRDGDLNDLVEWQDGHDANQEG